MSFEPRTRLEKILCGVATTARTRLEMAVKTAMDSVESALELPKVTASDNGKVLQVVSGKWKKGADVRPYEVVGTFSTNESSKTVITLDKTAAECYEAAAAGRCIVMTGQVAENTTIEEVLPICAEKITSGDQVGYKFRVTNEAGTGFASEAIAGSAAVVLTEESST